ncbi:MAG: hypothetical protein KC620_08845 [Myxococcales bacterium]|nr:hypothetical protein [Myxococcales bacterium]
MSSSLEFAEKLYARLSSMLDDLTSLKVETHTIDEQGTSLLRAETKVELDGDTTNRIPITAGKIDEAILRQHQKSVEQARNERKALVDTMMTIIRGRLDIEKEQAKD